MSVGRRGGITKFIISYLEGSLQWNNILRGISYMLLSLAENLTVLENQASVKRDPFVKWDAANLPDHRWLSLYSHEQHIPESWKSRELYPEPCRWSRKTGKQQSRLSEKEASTCSTMISSVVWNLLWEEKAKLNKWFLLTNLCCRSAVLCSRRCQSMVSDWLIAITTINNNQ